MGHSLSIRFWGVRGSIATGGPAFARVGGNTACVEVRAGNELIILDAGTGVYPLGQSLLEPVHATFLMSHFHWDHIQGFPLFRPAYSRANSFTIWGPGESADIKAAFRRQMEPPHFPVGLDTLGARLTFRALQPGATFDVGPVRVRTAVLNHPQGCLGYRLSLDGVSVVFATDTEPLESGAVDPGVLELASGADLLIHDSQYTMHEYDDGRRGWGHSTYDVACETARLAGVKCLALFHHDPSHDDAFVDRMLIAARALFPDSMIAREGLIIRFNASELGCAAVGDALTASQAALSLHAA